MTGVATADTEVNAGFAIARKAVARSRPATLSAIAQSGPARVHAVEGSER